MASPSRIEGDAHVNGNLSCKTFTCPAGAIEADDIASLAGIEATKLEHQHRINYSHLPAHVHG